MYSNKTLKTTDFVFSTSKNQKFIQLAGSVTMSRALPPANLSTNILLNGMCFYPSFFPQCNHWSLLCVIVCRDIVIEFVDSLVIINPFLFRLIRNSEALLSYICVLLYNFSRFFMFTLSTFLSLRSKCLTNPVSMFLLLSYEFDLFSCFVFTLWNTWLCIGKPFIE